MLEEFSNVLRLRLVKETLAKVEPMVIELHGKYGPVKAAPRRYPPAECDFL